MRLVPNVVVVASAPEGTVILFSCISVNQLLVGVDRTTCVGGVWIPDVNGAMCRGMIIFIDLYNSYHIVGLVIHSTCILYTVWLQVAN